MITSHQGGLDINFKIMSNEDIYEEYERALDYYNRGLKSIEEYSQVFRESFSGLISESRGQILEAMGVNQVRKAGCTGWNEEG